MRKLTIFIAAATALTFSMAGCVERDFANSDEGGGAPGAGGGTDDSNPGGADSGGTGGSGGAGGSTGGSGGTPIGGMGGMGGSGEPTCLETEGCYTYDKSLQYECCACEGKQGLWYTAPWDYSMLYCAY